MAKARVVLDRSGMSDLLHDSGVVGDLEQRMARVLSAAQASAPVRSGTYRDSLEVVTVERGSRTVVQVQAGADYAMIVEAATGNLSRALDAAGGA